jgi:hypothetical protein
MIQPLIESTDELSPGQSLGFNNLFGTAIKKT